MLLCLASCCDKAALQFLLFKFLVLKCLSSEDIQNISVEIDLSLSHLPGLALDSGHLACSEHLGSLCKMNLVFEDELLEVLSHVLHLRQTFKYRSQISQLSITHIIVPTRDRDGTLSMKEITGRTVVYDDRVLQITVKSR